MNRDWLARLLRQVSRTETEELSCTECFDLLPTAVELDLAGETGHPVWRGIAQHIGQCGVCREEFEVLRDFVRDEDEPLGEHGG